MFRRVLLGLSAALLLASTAQAQERLGILLMHGKQGTARESRTGMGIIASNLESAGHKVLMPNMPWAGSDWERINVTVEQVHALIDGYVAQLRGQGAQRIVVGDHSLGANVALSYAVARGSLAGIAMIAPGHNPGYVYRVEKGGRESIENARDLVQAGRGGEAYKGLDNNQGRGFTISTTAAVYYSWLDPQGLAVMEAQAPRLPANIPVLLVIGEKDPAFGRTQSQIYQPAAKHPYRKYVANASDHGTTPMASSKVITDWIVGLPR
ncbi:MAG TPA: alpha/beta hydrolase [Reyranellaceae bacterium]|nr:alpha/beta hydrolase [Reyranellaceae bacterium]